MWCRGAKVRLALRLAEAAGVWCFNYFESVCESLERLFNMCISFDGIVFQTLSFTADSDLLLPVTYSLNMTRSSLESKF